MIMFRKAAVFLALALLLSRCEWPGNGGGYAGDPDKSSSDLTQPDLSCQSESHDPFKLRLIPTKQESLSLRFDENENAESFELETLQNSAEDVQLGHKNFTLIIEKASEEPFFATLQYTTDDSIFSYQCDNATAEMLEFLNSED